MLNLSAETGASVLERVPGMALFPEKNLKLAPMSIAEGCVIHGNE
jgi:hypothetical protein